MFASNNSFTIKIKMMLTKTNDTSCKQTFKVLLPLLQITEMEITDSIGKKIEFSGVPFYIMDSKIYGCQHGKDRNAALKRKQQQQRREVSIRLCSL